MYLYQTIYYSIMKKILTTLFLLFSFLILSSQSLSIVAPNDMVVSCKFYYSDSSLSNVNDATFGQVVFDVKDRKNVITNDIVCKEFCEEDVTISYPGSKGNNASIQACEYYTSLRDSTNRNKKFNLTWGQDGYVTSTEKVEIAIQVSKKINHGIGLITRKFIATDSQGKKVDATQKIWIVNGGRFFINTLNLCDTTDDIEILECENMPTSRIFNCTSSYKSPFKIINDNCSLIAVEYHDERFQKNSFDYCLKISRTWTILDWNQFSGGKEGRWDFTELIYLIDNEAPTLTITSQTCVEADKDGFGIAEFEFLGYDSCTPSDWLVYSYYIDLLDDKKGKYNDEYDIFVSPLSFKEFNAGDKAKVADNPYAFSKNAPTQANGKYPKGKHRMKVLCQDGCLNTVEKIVYFEIIDSQKPIIQCKNSPATAIMAEKGFIEVFAKDFIEDVRDNCSMSENIKIYFHSGKGNDTIKCPEIVSSTNGTVIRNYQITAEDQIGNTASCMIDYIVTDPTQICNKIYTFSGKFLTINQKPIHKVELINLTPSINIIQSNNCDPYYQIQTIGSIGNTFEAYKKDSLFNGIDVSDILEIHDHLLSSKKINNPIALYCADINKSNTITASDISVLKHALLLDKPYQDIDKWLFFDSASLKPNPIEVRISDQTIIGCKIGDINASANTLCSDTIEAQLEKLYFNHDLVTLQANIPTKIQFYSSNFNQIDGFQASLKVNHPDVKINNIEIANLSLTSNSKYFNTSTIPIIHFRDGLTATNFPSNIPAFTVTVTSSQTIPIQINGLFSFTSELIKNIAYQNRVKQLELEIKNGITSIEDNILDEIQVYPNPSTLGFQIYGHQSSKMECTVTDVQGKVIFTENFKENNDRILSAENFPSAGVYFLKCKLGNYFKVIKLVKL